MRTMLSRPSISSMPLACPALLPQLEFADVVIVNKCDLLLPDPARLSAVCDVVRALNPAARLLTSTQADVDLSEVMCTGR